MTPEAIPVSPSPPPAGPPPPVPPRIPDYELLRIIGRGSYGDVWLARGITGLYRAVKLVWRDRFTEVQPYEREFNGLREFAAISLTEARQLALLHVGRNDAAGFFYYVMELADDLETGREIEPARYEPHTLKAVHERRGRLPASEVVTLGVDLSRALAGLHARGLVHRDVKPSNVIFVGGAPKLADIGLVTATTSAQTFVGTEGFVPPEGPGTPVADVFSLGKLLYEAATGLDRHEYPRLPADLGALPDRKELLELNEILIRACDPLATRRYADANALLDDLLLLHAGRSMRRLRAAERQLARAVRVGAVLALIAAIAGAGAFIERRRAESENTLRRHAEAERDDLARKTVYSAGLARTQRALELGDLGRAREQLRELTPKPGEPDLRGFEWRALWTEAQGDPADVLRESGPAAEKVRYSPDGTLLAVQTADKRVTLWDAATKKIVRIVEGVHRLAGFSSDGRWLVGTDPGFALQRWQVADGAPDAHPAPGTNRPLAAIGADRAVCFTDGTGDEPHTLRVWDFARHAEAARFEIKPDADGTRWDFYRGAVSADGTTCALALISGRAQEARWKLLVLESASRRILHSEVLVHRLPSLAFSRDGKCLAVALGDTVEVQVLDLARSTWRWRRTFGSAQANALAFSPDGARLAIASRDQRLHIADAASGEHTAELLGHNGAVEDVEWSPSERAAASVSNNGDVRLWREIERPARRIADGFWAPSSTGTARMSLSSNGDRLAIARDGQSVDILATDTLTPIQRLAGATHPIAFVDHDHSLLTATARGAVQRWPLAERDAAPAPELQLFDGGPLISAVALSPDGRWLAGGSSTGRIQFWELSSRRLASEYAASLDSVWTVSFSPSGETAAATGRPGVKVWHVPTGTLRAEIVVEPPANDIAFSAGRDRWLALGRTDGQIALYRGPTFTPTRLLRTTSARVQVLAFSPDNSRLVCGGPRGMVHIFATDDWRELVTFAAESDSAAARETAVSNLAFSSDGQVLAAYLADGRVRIWRSR